MPIKFWHWSQCRSIPINNWSALIRIDRHWDQWQNFDRHWSIYWHWSELIDIGINARILICNDRHWVLIEGVLYSWYLVGQKTLASYCKYMYLVSYWFGRCELLTTPDHPTGPVIGKWYLSKALFDAWCKVRTLLVTHTVPSLPYGSPLIKIKSVIDQALFASISLSIGKNSNNACTNPSACTQCNPLRTKYSLSKFCLRNLHEAVYYTLSSH